MSDNNNAKNNISSFLRDAGEGVGCLLICLGISIVILSYAYAVQLTR